MTIVRYCDYCGVVIGNGADVVQLQESDARGYRWCLVGEYHDYCWRAVSDGIVLVHEFGGSLQRIPSPPLKQSRPANASTGPLSRPGMQITREERDALWDLLVSDLMSVGDLALVLSRGDEDAAQRLHQRHIQDVRLLDHIGWQRTHHGQTFDLPIERDEDLAQTIQRLGISAATALADALRDIDFDAIQRLNVVCRTGARATNVNRRQHGPMSTNPYCDRCGDAH